VRKNDNRAERVVGDEAHDRHAVGGILGAGAARRNQGARVLGHGCDTPLLVDRSAASLHSGRAA